MPAMIWLSGRSMFLSCPPLALLCAFSLLGLSCSSKKNAPHPPSSASNDPGSLQPVPQASSSDEGSDDAPPDAGFAGIPDGGKYTDLPPRSVNFNGPFKIAAKAMQAWIHAYPDDETQFYGYIRAGTIVDRSEKPVRISKNCKSGWYEVLPKGYLCGGRRATIDLNDPTVVASWKRAKRGDPLPYNYVRPGNPLPYLYFTLPSKKEQERTENEKLESIQAKYPRDRIRNLSVLGEPEAIPDFMAPGKELPNPYGATKRLRYRSHEGRANPQAVFALLSVHDNEGRLFGLTAELDLLPIDRTKIVREPLTKGGPVVDLPAGIVFTDHTGRYTIDDADKQTRDGEYQRREVVSLTGKTKRDFWETSDGHWLKGGAMRVLQQRTSFPSFATESRKWIDISIKEQLLIAYVGTKAVYVAMVSTGLGELSDPTKTFATPRGVFNIKSKHVTDTMNGSAQTDNYEIADVPYVQYFQDSYALHGAFWHDDFGRVHSHGCVNLPPVDAAWIFEWTDPVVPPEWHGINASLETPGTIVSIHP